MDAKITASVQIEATHSNGLPQAGQKLDLIISIATN